MARVFITGSDGLGEIAAQLLIEQGHRVVLHARNAKRTKNALAGVPGAETAVSGDLRSIAPYRLFGPPRTIDWIFVNGSLRTRNGQVHNSVPGSDHFPVSLSLLFSCALP